MDQSLEHSPIKFDHSLQPAWLLTAAHDAHGPNDKTTLDSVGDFAKDHWKEIAGVGLVVIAGTAIVTRGRNFGSLGRLLKGGEAASEAAVGLKEGVAIDAATLGRLRNVKHFVFDMDRTLVDHDGALLALERTMTDGLAKSSGLSREVITDALKQTTKRLDSPYFWNRLDEIRPLQAHFPGVDLNVKFANVANSSKDAFYNALKAKPETVELLDTLHAQGKGVHVFTAGNPARALEKLNGAGLLNKVDSIYSSGIHAFEDSGAARLMTAKDAPVKLVTLPSDAKASGMGYDFIAKDLKMSGSRLAMTGDHPIEDVAMAKVHNYFTSQATWYKNAASVTSSPDLRLTSPSDLTWILRMKLK
jgi:Predicted hydrolase (HAD superfamily)